MEDGYIKVVILEYSKFYPVRSIGNVIIIIIPINANIAN